MNDPHLTEFESVASANGKLDHYTLAALAEHFDHMADIHEGSVEAAGLRLAYRTLQQLRVRQLSPMDGDEMLSERPPTAPASHD